MQTSVAAKMATNRSDVICLVNCGPTRGKGPFSKVIYFENANLDTFSYGNKNTGTGSMCELTKQEGGKPQPLVDWEKESPIWNATVKSPSELHFRIAILPKDSDRVGGAAYVTDGAMKSPSKVFHIYPGDQRETLYVDDGFEYRCVYYGTKDDRPIEALIERDKMGIIKYKIPDVVPWKLYASLGAETARVEENWKTANKELSAENEGLKKEKEGLETKNKELKKEKEESEAKNKVLKKEKEELETKNKGLEKEKEELVAKNKVLKKEKEELEAKNKELKKEKEDLEAKNKVLKKEKEELETEKEEVEIENRRLKKENKGLKKENERLEIENEGLETEIDRLKALAKAVVDALEGLKTYDNNRSSTTDNGTSTAGKNGTSTINGVAVG